MDWSARSHRAPDRFSRCASRSDRSPGRGAGSTCKWCKTGCSWKGEGIKDDWISIVSIHVWTFYLFVYMKRTPPVEICRTTGILHEVMSGTSIHIHSLRYFLGWIVLAVQSGILPPTILRTSNIPEMEYEMDGHRQQVVLYRSHLLWFVLVSDSLIRLIQLIQLSEFNVHSQHVTQWMRSINRVYSFSPNLPVSWLAKVDDCNEQVQPYNFQLWSISRPPKTQQFS